MRDQPLPQDLDAERSVLGSMMLDREAAGDVLPIIGESEARWFIGAWHAEIFAVLLAIFDGGLPMDLIAVRDELEKRSLLEKVGGADALVVLAESVASAVNVVYYAERVRDAGMLRDLIVTARAIEDLAYDTSRRPAEVFDESERAMFAVTERKVRGDVVRIAEPAREIAALLDQGAHSGVQGLATGYTSLDDKTGGWQAGDLVIVAGRPSMGKTSLGMDFARILSRRGVASLFFSLEMSKAQIATRLMCTLAGVESNTWRRGFCTPEQRDRLRDAIEEVQTWPLFIDDTPGLAPMAMRTKARRLAAQHGIAAVFVDYLQLMRAPAKGSNREQEVARISGSLKSLGRELGIPIIVMAQLNRSTESGGDSRPKMSSLRESGSIEQDADVVLLLHREEYYHPEKTGIAGQATLIIAKQRNGPTGDVNLYFNRDLTTFAPWVDNAADAVACEAARSYQDQADAMF